MEAILHGRVAQILNDSELVINIGREAGVKLGATFLVYEEGIEIKDPKTGASLGRIESIKGKISVSSVQDKLSIAHVVPRVVGQKYVPAAPNAKEWLSAFGAERSEGRFENIYRVAKLDPPKEPVKLPKPEEAGPILVGDLIRIDKREPTAKWLQTRSSLCNPARTTFSAFSPFRKRSSGASSLTRAMRAIVSGDR